MTPLTITGSTVQTYDGTAFVPDLSVLTYSITPPDTSHLLGNLTVSGAAPGAVHAGSYSYTPAGLYSDQLGYLITYATGTLRINPATLTVTGTRVGSRIYNGTTVAILSGGSLVGVISGDTVSLTQSGSYASRNAGTGIAVTATDRLGGAEAGDYVLVEPTGVAGSISPAPLTVTGTTVASKVYDGTSVAALRGGALVGVFAGDTVTLSQAGSFSSRSPGTGIAVTAADTLGGASALDYSLVEPTGLSGTITSAGSANMPGTPGTAGGASSPLLAAYYASAQLDSNLLAPQWGAEPQVIDASPSIDVVQTAMEPASTDPGEDQDSSSSSDQGVIINVAMKIGAVGTLTILDGGVRLPWSRTQPDP
jgi:putative effector of murein hydrolase